MLEPLNTNTPSFSLQFNQEEKRDLFLKFNESPTQDEQKKIRDFFINELGRSIQKHLEKMKKHYRKMKEEYYR